MRMNIHNQLSSVMLVCKNPIVTFWNVQFNKKQWQINFLTAFFHTASYMENKAHFIPLICPHKMQYIGKMFFYWQVFWGRLKQPMNNHPINLFRL